jgi:uncharacterized membrane-anchored protein
MRKNLAVLALVLMVLSPSLLMVKAMYDRANGTIWQVNITGFDPRDLLRGHYLNFRYDWSMLDAAPADHCTAGQPCCLCLTRMSDNNYSDPLARYMACEPKDAVRASTPSCDSRIIGGNPHGAQIYYVPEKHALRLERLLRGGNHDFKMEIAVPRSGGPAIIRDLYIDQKPLAEFLKSAD